MPVKEEGCATPNAFLLALLFGAPKLKPEEEPDDVLENAPKPLDAGFPSEEGANAPNPPEAGFVAPNGDVVLVEDPNGLD